MSHVDDPPSAAGLPDDDDAFAEGASALLGGVTTGAADDDDGGAAGDRDDDGFAGGDAAPEGLTSWHDPIAEADAERRAGDEAYEAALLARKGPPRDTRGRKRREWRQTERARRYAARRSVRFPIFTRSILLWMLIFAIAGLTFGASGAFWWAQFNSQITQLKEDTRDFEQRSQNAQEQINAERNAALTQIKEATKPLAGFLSEPVVVSLAQNFKTKVWTVQTLDVEGKASVGSAFAVMSDKNETLMVTSYHAIEANTLKPGPPQGIRVVKDADYMDAELWATDPGYDLALLLVKRGNIEVMDWAADDVAARLQGSRVFVVSGLGGNGATLSPGLVVDVSSSGLRHTAAVGEDFEGGPIINVEGKVVGVASRTYGIASVGFIPQEVRFAPAIARVCDRVLSCGGAKKKPDAKIIIAPSTTVGPNSSTTQPPTTPTTAQFQD